MRLLLVGMVYLLIISNINCSKDKILNNQSENGSPWDTALIHKGETLPFTGIWGYTDKVSYDQGETIHVFIGSDSSYLNKTIFLYDINAHPVMNFHVKIPKQTIQNKDPWMNGFGIRETFNFSVPFSIKSGLYLLNNNIPVVIKNIKRNAAITIIYPSNTVNAYNYIGGKSLYVPNTATRARIVSFLRPQSLQYYVIPFFKWINLLNNSYEIQYIADVDLENYTEIGSSKLLIITGHSEYWTRKGRESFDKFVSEGHNAIVLSGNTMYWQVRYSTDKTKMICYKSYSEDPISNPLLKTINWFSSILDYPTQKSIGNTYILSPREPFKFGGFKILNEKSPLLEGVGLRKGDILYVKTSEYDGILMKFDSTHHLYLDKLVVPPNYRYEIVGFDSAYAPTPRIDGYEKDAVFVVYQPGVNSGTVINMSSTDWCSPRGIGGANSEKLKKITLNAINKSLTKVSVF